MLTDLDKKLKTQIDREIYRKNNRKKFNIHNAKIISLGWIFVLNIFLFVILGCFIKKYVINSSFVFILIIVIGVIFSFFNLKNIIEVNISRKHN